MNQPEGESDMQSGDGATSDSELSPVELIKEQRAWMESKFKDIFRQIGKSKRAEPVSESKPSAPATGGGTAEDINAMYAFVRISQSLPDEVQEKLEELRQGGASFKELANYAELVSLGAGAKPNKAQTTKRGVAATGAQNPPVVLPRTSEEFRMLKKAAETDPKARKHLKDVIHHPGFDLQTLE